jgi:hypothetical protein
MHALLRLLLVVTPVAVIITCSFEIQRGVAREPADSSHAILNTIDSTGLLEPGDDGPYVFLQPDSSAVVINLCHGRVERRVFHDFDTLRFPYFCADSGVEYVIPRMPPVVDAQVLSGVSRIFTVSDIHGEFESLVEVLQNCGVIDKDMHWLWGTGHLVVLGDVFDRGDNVTDCLWLVYRLEQEARAAGGRVHVLLGNHELMVLKGDYRYVHENYLSGIVAATGLEYKALYGTNTVLGRWLRSRHAAMKINGMLFVHGGIAPLLVERGVSLAQIDEEIRSGIDDESSTPAVDSLRQLLLGKYGPLWYRGYICAMEDSYPLASGDDIDRVLQQYGVSTIVVGHTEVAEVSGLHQNRVIAIDVPVEELGGLQALLWEDGKYYRVARDGNARPIE